MTEKSNLITFEKLVTLVFVLILSTASFVLLIFTKIPTDGWGEKIRLVLLSFGLFGYGFLILSFVVHYVEKANSWFRADKKRVILAVALLLAIGHATFAALDAGKWFSFLSTLTGDGIIIIGLQSADKIFAKWGKKKSSSKK